MNTWECDIVNILLKEQYTNQRVLARMSGHSLGLVNRVLKSLAKEDYIDRNMRPTAKAINEFNKKAPQNAVILAAGPGIRMVPINVETSKGLIKVNGECLIERLIKQLHEVGIRKIYVVVGFMKEQYEYLIDKYDVKLIVNMEYAVKNNLHSLKRVLNDISNTYIIPCDVWCAENPFGSSEPYSWYMISDAKDDKSAVRVNRKNELVRIGRGGVGNPMIGIAYLLEEQAAIVRQKIRSLAQNREYDGSFWEEALYSDNKMIVQAKVIPSKDVIEINTYEQLRALDGDSEHLKTNALETIAEVLNVQINQITDITPLKRGMTNRSFLFMCNDIRYIMRIPGEGTDLLIDRAAEADAYSVIQNTEICDDVIYINPQNGYKITRYICNARPCDPNNIDDVRLCMDKLREFHSMKLKTTHTFDIFKHIDYYESLWYGQNSVYIDYLETKANVLSLKGFVKRCKVEICLTHIDAVPDNFLICDNESAKPAIRLIDWEYAGMQDPHVDIAMFCIYSLYNRRQIDELIDLYFNGVCTTETRIKIYCYVSACGLLWSNWCEYKRQLGVEFGEYALRQYRYAKDYYNIAVEEMEKMEESGE